MIYLASPYSHTGSGTEDEKAQTRERRYRQTMFAQKSLFNFGYPVFATIVHNHVTTKHYKLPSDFGYWQRYNHHMIDLSRAVFILQLEGWEKSSGVQDEIDYANSKAIPVYAIPVIYDDDTIRLDIPIIPELQTLIRFKRPVEFIQSEFLPLTP